MSLNIRGLRILYRRYPNVYLCQKSYCQSLEKETLPISVYQQLGDEPSEIFAYLEKNQNHLNGQHFIQVLHKLRKSRTLFSDDNQGDFAFLCNEFKKRLRTLNVSEASVALELIKELNVPTQTVIFESLLQIIRADINFLTIDDVIRLQINLKDVKKTPLVEAILIALPTIFQVQLPKINRNDIHLLTMCLVFATKQKYNDDESIQFILKTISKYQEEIPLKLSILIFNSLTFIPNIAISYNNLLHRVQYNIINQISTISHVDVMGILKFMSQCKLDLFYNEHLIDSLINTTIIEKGLNFEEGIKALNFLTKMNHNHVALLDYLSTKCFEDSDLIKNSDPHLIYTFVSGMAMGDYKPVFWERIQELIMANELIQQFEGLVKFVYKLAILECYPSNLIARVFELYKNPVIIDSVTRDLIVRLNQIITTHNLECKNLLASGIDLNEFFNWNQYNSRTFPLSNVLNFIWGPEFVATKIGTRLGHFIDHVVILGRKDNIPIAISREVRGKSSENIRREIEKDHSDLNITLLEDIFVSSEESDVILFLNIPPDGYTKNSVQLKGEWNSYIRTLEALNYFVIPVCSERWLKLPEKQKIPYILQAIRFKREIYYNR